MPVQTFTKPKRVRERDKVLGIRPVAKLVMVSYADEDGNLDDRLALVADDDSVVMFPKGTMFDPPKDSLKKQLLQRLKVAEMNVKPQLSGMDIVPVKAKPPEKKVEEASD
jgi:hypothetical protein